MRLKRLTNICCTICIIESEPNMGHGTAELHAMLQAERVGVGPVWLPLEIASPSLAATGQVTKSALCYFNSHIAIYIFQNQSLTWDTEQPNFT